MAQKLFMRYTKKENNKGEVKQQKDEWIERACQYLSP